VGRGAAVAEPLEAAARWSERTAALRNFVQSELLEVQPQRVALAACSRSAVPVSASSTEQSNEAAALEPERQSSEQ